VTRDRSPEDDLRSFDESTTSRRRTVGFDPECAVGSEEAVADKEVKPNKVQEGTGVDGGEPEVRAREQRI
jgi:hypothetical protein